MWSTGGSTYVAFIENYDDYDFPMSFINPFSVYPHVVLKEAHSLHFLYFLLYIEKETRAEKQWWYKNVIQRRKWYDIEYY